MVNEHVLIPRPETEELVDWILMEHDNEPLTICDLGTGSGCIAISLKLKRPHWKVYGIDLSAQALEVARINANDLKAEVSFIEGDMTRETDYPIGIQLIVSNPPYVLPSDHAMLSRSVARFEPAVALFVPDEDAVDLL